MKLSIIIIHRAIPTANTAAYVILFSINPQICWLYQRWTFVLEMEITGWDAVLAQSSSFDKSHQQFWNFLYQKNVYMLQMHICTHVHVYTYCSSSIKGRQSVRQEKSLTCFTLFKAGALRYQWFALHMLFSLQNGLELRLFQVLHVLIWKYEGACGSQTGYTLESLQV